MTFFRIEKTDEQYKKELDNELKNFKERIIRRAQEKLDAAVKEIEETEREKRLGPGGLDPVEVFESLPQVNSIEWRSGEFSVFHLAFIHTIFFL